MCIAPLLSGILRSDSGATAGINTAEAAGRTRVVIDLYRPSTYESHSDGNNFILTVGGGATGTAAALPPVSNDPTKAIGAARVEISNIDFRRGKDGQGRVVISFSGEGASADLERHDIRIALDIYNARLPNQLAQRSRCSRFPATPVQFVETHAKGTGAHMDISAESAIRTTLAYQSGNQYVIEVAPAKEKERIDRVHRLYIPAIVSLSTCRTFLCAPRCS